MYTHAVGYTGTQPRVLRVKHVRDIQYYKNNVLLFAFVTAIQGPRLHNQQVQLSSGLFLFFVLQPTVLKCLISPLTEDVKMIFDLNKSK